MSRRTPLRACLALLGLISDCKGTVGTFPEGLDVLPTDAIDDAPLATIDGSAIDGSATDGSAIDGSAIDGSPPDAGDPGDVPATLPIPVTYRLDPSSGTVEAPPPSSYVACPGYSSTAYWAIGRDAVRVSLRRLAGVPGTAYSVAFIMPDAPGIGRFAIAEYAGAPTPRQAHISTVPCDFAPADGEGVTVSVNFTRDAPPFASVRRLQPGRLYFLNVTSRYSGVENCAGGAGTEGPGCDFFIDYVRPR